MTTTIKPGCEEIGGRLYMRDAQGRLVPYELVRPVDQLQDELVRKIIGYADELSRQIDRFKGHTADDIGSFQALIADEYGARPRGGAKGNVTFSSYDGTLRVEVRIAESLSFGPELQAAKLLIDDCIGEWSADANGPVRALVNHAFQVDQAGRINRGAILSLRRVAIDDPRWRSAMEAITDAIRVEGSKTHYRFWRRSSTDEPWTAITIDIASARAPRGPAEEAA